MQDQPPIACTIIPVTPFEQNSTLLWCRETMRGAVTDPGGEIDRHLAAAERAGVTIEKILVTHGHLDHCAATRDLADRLGVPIEGPHPDDEFWIDGLPAAAAQFGFPVTRRFVPDRWLHHGDEVTVGNQRLQVVHCPGHTPGHVVFFHEGARLAWVGDVLFQGSIGRTDFPRGNLDHLIASITGRLWPLGDDVAFIPGHGGTSTFGRERRANPFVGDAVLARVPRG